jgi:cyclic pyranopterin phosphate synthase
MQTLVDRQGRAFPYLRLSLTEACNFRCSYCPPEGYEGGSHPLFLALAEIVRLVRGFASLGVSKIRLTGGEPSLRKDLPSIIGAVSAVPGIRKIALTTNGCLLPRRARGWREAGLTALNVSLDSLDAKRFRVITGHDRFAEVVDGIELALGLGFNAVKINAVLLRECNDDEMEA